VARSPDSCQPEDPNASTPSWLCLALVLLLFFIVSQWGDWQTSHQKRARRTAYRRRHQWRKADVPRLLKLGVPMERIQRITDDNNKRRGRGVVQSYQSLDEVVTLRAEQFNVLLAADTPPHSRLSTLKQTPFWRYIVEALYRGEHTAAKEIRQKSASSHAEQVVAGCLGISDSQVRKICVGVRKERKRENRPAYADSEFLLRVNEFEAWQRTGDLQIS
jgi:hypothetical protein